LRRALLVSLILMLALGIFDVTREPGRQVSANVAIYAIGLYKQYISPEISGVVKCKFTPTCSQYAVLAIEKHGIIKGGWLTIRRLARCSPLSDDHGDDYP
jgi:putative membrane protein insertion efficiency factor